MELQEFGGGEIAALDAETNLGLIAIVNGQELTEKGAETGFSITNNSLIEHKAPETSAVVGKLADAVKHEVDNLLADGVVATGEQGHLRRRNP